MKDVGKVCLIIISIKVPNLKVSDRSQQAAGDLFSTVRIWHFIPTETNPLPRVVLFGPPSLGFFFFCCLCSRAAEVKNPSGSGSGDLADAVILQEME